MVHGNVPSRALACTVLYVNVVWQYHHQLQGWLIMVCGMPMLGAGGGS